MPAQVGAGDGETGPDHAAAVGLIRRIIGRAGWDRDALWIEGDTGTGKTSTAQALARELDCPPGSWGYEEIDGDKCTVDEVRRLDETVARCRLFAEQWRVVVVNEAHAMTARAIQAWLTFLEKLPARWLIVFTTTEPLRDLFGNFNHAFAGRVKEIRLTKFALAQAFGKRLREIAKAEDLDGRRPADYVRLVQANRGDFRRCLQLVEMGEMVRPSRLTEAQQKAVRNLVRRTRARKRRAAAGLRRAQSSRGKAKARKGPKAGRPKK